jgi:uncharacterized protein (DUF924 family)
MSGTRPTCAIIEPTWVEQVIRYWFDDVGPAQWFAAGEAIDARIRGRFLQLHERIAAHDELVPSTQRALLAAVIVLDQFSRHLFRATPRAYAADHLARQLSTAAIAQGLDVAMNAEERFFLYLPFEHSEDPVDQALAVHLIERIGNEQWTHDAIRHKEVIDRYQRFPHRNAILNRQSSADELALLQEPEDWF